MRSGRPPNILMLMTDQQRYDSLRCYGAAFAHTPNLDRCAAEGVVFDHCYVNNPICTPSRASMFTGKHLPEHGVYRLYDNLPDHEVLFTKRLQQMGYTTALFGKLHVSAGATESRQRHPNDGFDIYEPCLEGCLFMDAPYQAYARWLEQRAPDFYSRLKQEGRELLHPPRELHLTHWAAERTIDFIRQHATSKNPFFCMMSIFEPHNPYEHFPAEMGALVDADSVPEPIPKNSSGGEPPDIDRERHHSYFGDMDDFSPEKLRKIRHGYHASVAYSDLEFGRVLDALDAAGLTEDTLVIFTSDHGDMLGDHGLLVKGAFFFDPNVRVPLLMRWPGRISSGLRISSLVQLHDLAATILAAAGTSPETLCDVMPDADNMLALVEGREQRIHDDVICCYRNSGISMGGKYWDPPIHATMIRDARFKLNLWHSPSNSNRGELYDMVNDPQERTNLWQASDLMEVRAKVSERLHAWIDRHEGQMSTTASITGSPEDRAK